MSAHPPVRARPPHRWCARRRGRPARPVALVLLALVVVLAGCASVPDNSPVQVLRRVSEGDAPPPPPGPADGAEPSEIVRGFVNAAGSSADRHGAARRFLAPDAAGWEDSGPLTILDGQLDTVPAPGAPPLSSGATIVRIRGTAVGRINATGSFEPDESPVEIDVTVAQRAGQWRITRLPNGIVVPLSAFRENYRAVKAYFVDPTRRAVVPDLRYLPAVPVRAYASRVLELLLDGPSDALIGAARSQFGSETRLRSNVAAAADGALVVDLTGVGELDEQGRRLLAAQVVLSLSEVGVDRVRLLVDGEPFLPEAGDLTRQSLAAQDGDVRPSADVPALVVAGGRLRQLTGPEPGAALPGQVGNGALDVQSAASTVDGRRLAVVVREGAARRRLLIGGGPDGGVSPAGLAAGSMTRPTWTPTGDEVWTVLDGMVITRVLLPEPPGTPPRIAQVNAAALTAMGPVTDLRLSRDGMRVLAVVGGALHTAAVTRSVDGEAAIRNIRRVRAQDLGEVVGADWRDAESIIAITAGGARPVVQVSVDGLALQGIAGTNLTPPLRAVAAGPSRPVVVTDGGGVWSYGGGDQVAWRAVLGGVPDAVPLYPG